MPVVHMASSEADTLTLEGRRFIESSVGNGTAVKSLAPMRRVQAFSNSASPEARPHHPRSPNRKTSSDVPELRCAFSLPPTCVRTFEGVVLRRLERRLQTGSTAFAGTSAALSVNQKLLEHRLHPFVLRGQDRSLSSVSWLVRRCSPETSDRQLHSKKSQT